MIILFLDETIRSATKLEETISQLSDLNMDWPGCEFLPSKTHDFVVVNTIIKIIVL